MGKEEGQWMNIDFGESPEVLKENIWIYMKILEVLKYSLEQYIGFVGRLAFIHYCGLHQV